MSKHKCPRICKNSSGEEISNFPPLRRRHWWRPQRPHYLRGASGPRPRHLQRSPTAKKSTVEPTHPRGAGGRNYQWLTPIDYVKITLSFLKRSFLLHNWRKPCGAYIPTESRKAGSTETRGGRETEKDNENVSHQTTPENGHSCKHI